MSWHSKKEPFVVKWKGQEYRLSWWVRIGISAAVLIIVMSYTYANHVDPAVKKWQSGRDGKFVPSKIMTRQQESLKHFPEEPCMEFVAADESVEIKRYCSDNCFAIIWHTPIPDPSGTVREREIVQWALHWSRVFEIKDVVAWAAQPLRAMLSGFVPERDACEGKCVWPHPGIPYEEVVGDPEGCVVSIQWTYDDYCVFGQNFDRCEGVVTSEVYPICCRH